jgi:hypothetical protein
MFSWSLFKRCTSNSSDLILSFFSYISHTMFSRFCSNAFVKAILSEAIKRGSLPIFFITYSSIITDKMAEIDISKFLVLCKIIFLESLSNLKQLKVTTFRAVDGVCSPNPNFPNGKCHPVRGIFFDDPKISISDPCQCLFLPPIYFFVLPLFLMLISLLFLSLLLLLQPALPLLVFCTQLLLILFYFFPLMLLLQ